MGALIPDPERLAEGDITQTEWVEVDRIFLETSRYASVHQRIYSQNILMGETETKSYPVQIRCAGPRNSISWLA